MPEAVEAATREKEPQQWGFSLARVLDLRKLQNNGGSMSHVGWRYFENPYRKFCGRWWRNWFNFKALWRDAKDALHRARLGWAKGDIYDLVTYHAGVTIGLLKHFRDHHVGVPMGVTPEEYIDKIDLAIDGWEAKYLLLTDHYWDAPEEAKDLETRWEKGHAAFTEIYDSLWN